MSEVSNNTTIESFWAIATHFTLEEGGPWLEKIPNQAFGTADFHALKLPNCEWDVICGLRIKEQKDDPELVRIPEHSNLLGPRIEFGDFGGLETGSE